MFDDGAIGCLVGLLATRVNALAEKLGAVLPALPGAPRAAATVLAGSLGGLDGSALLPIRAPDADLRACRSPAERHGRPARDSGGRADLRAGVRAAAADAGSALAVVASAGLCGRLLFGGGEQRDELALAVLWAAVRWTVAMLVLGVTLRVRTPAIRLLPTTSDAARRGM